jgi:hypothetical protein
MDALDLVLPPEPEPEDVVAAPPEPEPPKVSDPPPVAEAEAEAAADELDVTFTRVGFWAPQGCAVLLVSTVSY